MTDDWFGHRDIYGLPHGDKDEYTRWDYALINAFQIIESGTDSDGLLVWEYEDEGTDVLALRKVNKFHAARDRKINSKTYSSVPGEYFVPEVIPARHRNGVPQTREEWLKTRQEEIEKEASKENG